jgi:Phosphotransferase enzyme family
MGNSPKYLSDSDQQELLEKLRKYLEKRYQTEIVELIQLDRGVLHAVRRKSPNWVVRVFSPLRPLELAQGDAQVLGFLEKQGFPAERCADPNPVSNPAGRPVVITEFVEGEKPEPSQEVFKRLGELLGDLNSLNSNNIREGGSLHHYAKLGGAPRKEIDAAISWLEEIKEKVPKQNEEMFNLLHTELSGADDCHDLPKALVHPDAILKNIVRTQDDKLVLVD